MLWEEKKGEKGKDGGRNVSEKNKASQTLKWFIHTEKENIKGRKIEGHKQEKGNTETHKKKKVGGGRTGRKVDLDVAKENQGEWHQGTPIA